MNVRYLAKTLLVFLRQLPSLPAICFQFHRLQFLPRHIHLEPDLGFGFERALTFTDLFHAGASHFGVSDAAALARDTHKFESRYLDGLIAPYPEREDLYRERSPIDNAGRLSCPVIFLQGLEDRIVPPDQSARMAAAIREKGIPVALLEFPGEQHGFRRAENVQRALEAELYFYAKVFKFIPADEIEPVTIDNLAN